MGNRSGYINEMKVEIRRKDGKDGAIGGLKLSDIELNVADDVVGQVNRHLDDIYNGVRNENIRGQIDPAKIRQESYSIVIGTAETKVPHGLGQKPTEYCVTPKEQGVWWQSRAPDTSYLYLQATAAISVDVVIKG